MEKEEEEEEVLCRSFGQFSSSSKMAPLRQSDARSLPFFLSSFLFFLSADSLFLRRIKNNRKTTMALRWRCDDVRSKRSKSSCIYPDD